MFILLPPHHNDDEEISGLEAIVRAIIIIGIIAFAIYAEMNK